LNGSVSAGSSSGQLSSLATGLASGYSSSSSSLSGVGGVFGRSGSSSSALGGGSSSGGAKPIQRFKGHQNTAKNIVRASFGPREAFVLGGSEDGRVYVWDVVTGKLLETLPGHRGVTYNAKWHEKQALMASSSHDGTVKTWWWRDDRPLR
jgi:WD40 repeat protein